MNHTELEQCEFISLLGFLGLASFSLRPFFTGEAPMINGEAPYLLEFFAMAVLFFCLRKMKEI